MKLFTITLAFLGLATQLSVASAFAGLPEATIIALQGYPVRVLSASIETSGTTAWNTQINIYAIVEYSNACMASDQLVTSDLTPINVVTNQVTLQLLGANSVERLCTMEYMPVQKRVLVRTIYSDMMPSAVIVNGVTARH